MRKSLLLCRAQPKGSRKPEKRRFRSKSLRFFMLFWGLPLSGKQCLCGHKGQIEIREYYQTEDIKWLSQKKNWKGLSSIVMEKKTLKKEGNTRIENRYFISSLKGDIEQVSRAVRGHWSIESMHWYLDVTFREDANTTIDKLAAQNLNIIRKWSLSILKPAQITRHKLSMRKKRFVLSLRPIQYLEELLEA